LLKYMTSSQLDIEEMFQRVRLDVIRASNGSQVPWTASSLVGTLHLLPALDANLRPLDLGVSDGADSTLGARVPTEHQDASSRAVTSVPPEALGSAEVSEAIKSASLASEEGELAAVGSRLKSAVAIDPGNLSLQRLLGVTYALQGRGGDAKRAFDTVLETNPLDAAAAVERCVVDTHAAPREALIDCESAVRIVPASFDAHAALAMALLEAGNTARAYTEASRAIELSPKVAVGFALRGRIAAALGYQAIAKQDYQRAVRLADEPDTARH